jgi:hypothetical protein
MTVLQNFTKHPEGKNRLRINTNRSDAAIAMAATFESEPVGLLFEEIELEDDHVLVLIGGGVNGTSYKVNGPITLSNDEVPVAEFHVTVVDQP